MTSYHLKQIKVMQAARISLCEAVGLHVLFFFLVFSGVKHELLETNQEGNGLLDMGQSVRLSFMGRKSAGHFILCQWEFGGGR